jgi:hypothetical protein
MNNQELVPARLIDVLHALERAALRAREEAIRSKTYLIFERNGEIMRERPVSEGETATDFSMTSTRTGNKTEE